MKGKNEAASRPQEREKAGLEFSQYVDHTTFAVVRSALNPRSPIKCLLAVFPPLTLEEAAAVVTGSGGSILPELLKAGSLRFLAPAEKCSQLPGSALPLDDIPDKTPCRVLYLPPVYLLALEDFNFPPVQHD